MRYAFCRAAVLALGCVVACAPTPRSPDLTEIYRNAAAAGAEGRRPLIAVPGILGSRLIADTEDGLIVVWGGGPQGGGISVNPDTPEGARLIALPIGGNGETLAELRDEVRAERVLDTAYADVLGLPIQIDVYGGITRTLRAGGFRVGTATASPQFASGPGRDNEDFAATATTNPPGASIAVVQGAEEAALDSYQFAYDWRRDIVENARALGRFIRQRQAALAEERSRTLGRPVSPSEIRFDIICHSMGGLVVRYYLMYGEADLPTDGSLPELTWAGAQNVSRVVFVAPPNGGSILALDNVVNGKELGPFQPFYPPALTAAHPAIFELMPRARHALVRWDSPDGPPVLDLYDPALWERFGWGFADPSQAEILAWLMPEEADPEMRRQRALAHQAAMLRRAEHFHRALDRSWTVEPPAGLDMYLVAGSGFRTPYSAVLDSETGALTITGFAEGDGVVTRASVLLDERQGQNYRPGLLTPLDFRSILFLPAEHVDLTKNPVFGDNLLFWLLEAPRSDEDLVDPRRDGFVGTGPARRALTSVLSALPAPASGVSGLIQHRLPDK